MLLSFIFPALIGCVLANGTTETQDQKIERLSQRFQKMVDEQRIEIDRLQHRIESLDETMSQWTLAGAMHRSCEELHRNYQFLPSGEYWIDPDGLGVGDPPIFVYCNMIDGTTIVSHDSEEVKELEHCLEPGCYTRSVEYMASLRQLTTLANLLSSSCSQYIKFECFAIPLEFNGVQQAWWTDSKGQRQYYWAGNGSYVDHTCQCGIDGNCVVSAVNCNCDVSAPILLNDQGYLTDKSILPVTALSFGRSLVNSSYATHQLGKLHCSGRTNLESKKPQSCADLWLQGHSSSGIFSVLHNNTLQSVFCDFSKVPGDEGLQIPIGLIDVKSTTTQFLVERIKAFNTLGESNTLVFNVEPINTGGSMNSSNGVFTAPVSGTFFFSFAGVVNESDVDGASAVLYARGKPVARAYSKSNDSSWVSLSMSSLLDLQKNDEVYVEIRNAVLYDSPYARYTHFTGVLMEEHLSK